MALGKLLLGGFDASELLLAHRGILQLLLLHFDLLLDAVQFSLLKAELLRVRKLLKLAGALKLS